MWWVVFQCRKRADVGWYATHEALINKNGRGPYGTVRESLRRECDPLRTLWVALNHIALEKFRQLGSSAKRRVAYWRWRCGLKPMSALAKEGG